MFSHTLKRRAAVLLTAAAILCCAASAFGWDSESEIMRLKDEVPSMEIYGTNDAVIWLRDNESRILADGSMENLRRLIVMIGEKVPDGWKTLRYTVPAEGGLVVEEAAWYNTMTGMKEGDIPVTDETLPGGAEAKVISVPDDTVGRALVVSIREKRANRYGVDETVNMAGSLPIWEQNISVEVPEGMEIFWTGRDMKEPSVSDSGGRRRYRWQVMNQLPWNGEGFVLNERPMLSFSSKKGLNQSLRSLDEIARSMPPIDPPSSIKGSSVKTAERLIDWVNSPERTLSGYPNDWVRRPDQIPVEGPWTPWEQTLLLNRWLQKLGFESEIWWEGKMPLDASSPASISLLAEPVLEFRLPNAQKTSYFIAGHPFKMNRVPFSIAGREIYAAGDAEYKSKTLPQGSSSDNRLSLLWKLKLDGNGRAEGRLTVSVNGGWSDLFSGNVVPSIDNINDFLLTKLNFAIPGMVLKAAEVSQKTLGYEMVFDVSCVPGIVHGDSMLLRLPGGIPTRVSEMIGREQEYTLRFPFIIDQKVRMSMPKGFRLLQSPPLKQLGDGTKVVLKESITHWPKKAELLADSLWVVKTCNVDGITAQLLKEELAASLRWPVLDLPFKK